MILNETVGLYKYTRKYDPRTDSDVEESAFVNEIVASVEEVSGNQYLREYGVFKRNIIRVNTYQRHSGFTHIKYKGGFYKVIDDYGFRHYRTIVAEEV